MQNMNFDYCMMQDFIDDKENFLTDLFIVENLFINLELFTDLIFYSWGNL